MTGTERTLIDFLLDPRSYPERTGAVFHIETHISHVFVGDRFVYKVKKPVDFGFLDFSTLRKRHFFCQQEVVLNSRLAKGIYVGVEPLYRSGAGFSFASKGGRPPAEYAVKMKRIPLDRLLFKLIGEGRPLYGSLEDVGRTLAGFHEGIAPYRGARFGGVESIIAATEENFEQLGPFTSLTVGRKTLAMIERYTRAFIADHGAGFAERRKNGFVRDGHGDLHCQHVCLEHPPVIFDCIEFNRGFRTIDILEDIAFLFMDLEYRGRFDLSARLHKAYFARLPKALDEELLRFYKVYRAVVRGKVEGFAARGVEDASERERAVARARDYFGLAGHYISHFQKPFNPVVFMGLSGSGKSTIARDFSPNAVILRSDEMRKEITGVGKGRHAYSSFGEGIYTPELTNRIYCLMLERAVECARMGKKVIVDATYLKADERRDFYETCIAQGQNPFFIHCFASEAVLKERIGKRMEAGTDASDADIAVLEHQLEHLEEPEELPSYRILRINTEDAIHNIIHALREFL
jgi:aminoglycoside phosphotransferase family enzyme/predicted kinase